MVVMSYMPANQKALVNIINFTNQCQYIVLLELISYYLLETAIISECSVNIIVIRVKGLLLVVYFSVVMNKHTGHMYIAYLKCSDGVWGITFSLNPHLHL